MRLWFYIFLISQILNILIVFAQKEKSKNRGYLEARSIGAAVLMSGRLQLLHVPPSAIATIIVMISEQKSSQTITHAHVTKQ